jgi:hypothetical protein
MTKVKALAIAAIATITFLSLGLGISAHSSRKDTGDSPVRSVAQADAVAMPADPIGLSGSSPAARSVRHEDEDDDHVRDGEKTIRSSTHDRAHDDEDEDD